MYFIIMFLSINSPTFSSSSILFILTHTHAHTNSCSQIQCIANTKFLSEAQTQSDPLSHIRASHCRKPGSMKQQFSASFMQTLLVRFLHNKIETSRLCPYLNNYLKIIMTLPCFPATPCVSCSQTTQIAVYYSLLPCGSL